MNSPEPYSVVITDLDDTLLGQDYRPGPAGAAVTALAARGIPLVFCSSKTRAEQLEVREKLGVKHPFIVENGAALLLPCGYFPTGGDEASVIPGYRVIEFAAPLAEVRESLARVRREQRLPLRGYGDMTVAEVASLTVLDAPAAARACAREYSETVVITGSAPEVSCTIRALGNAGLECVPGGRYYSVHRGADKGRAATALLQMYRRQHGAVRSIGIGDSPNDATLLAAVDVPVLVRRPSGDWSDLDLPGLIRVDGIGPEGFNQALRDLAII